MNTFIALLRGINVSGQKKILMVDLRSLFESLGYHGMRTYIQSGNVIFSSKTPRRELETQISGKIKEVYGWDVSVLVRTSDEIAEVLHNCPFSEEKKEKSYFTLFQDKPKASRLVELRAVSYPGEEFFIDSKCLYYYCETGYGKAKMTNNLIERKLKVKTTTRNQRTMVKLLEIAAL